MIQAEQTAGTQWNISLDPERGVERVLLVVPEDWIERDDLWTIVGFTDEQSARIQSQDGWAVANAPRPIPMVGNVDVTGEDGRVRREYLIGEEVRCEAGEIWPNRAPFAHGRFYVAADPTWQCGRRPMAQAWKSEADAWPVIVLTPDQAGSLYLQRMVEAYGMTEEEARAEVTAYGDTVLDAARYAGYPIPDAYVSNRFR